MMFSDLAHRLVGQEMFHVLDKAGVIERSGGKVYHLDLSDIDFYRLNQVSF